MGGALVRFRKDFLGQAFFRKVDWIFLVVLTILFAAIEYIAEPNQWFISPEHYEGLRYPHRKNTVPSWAVPLISLSPLVLVGVAAFWPKMLGGLKIKEVHDLLLALLMTIAITANITSSLKVTVGRPRPDFLARCFPDGVDNVKKLPGFPECNGNSDDVKDGLKSFPSGHSSWAMCSMAFTTFFLLGKLRAFDGKGETWRLVVSFLPLTVGIAVGVTRVTDYRHHFSDVVAGAVIGLLVALFVYCMYYPWPLERDGTELPLYLTLEQKGLSSLSQNTSMLGSLEPLQIAEAGIPAGCPEVQ